MTNTVSKVVAGVDHGQRQLNGPQTTGREYPNLSQPQYSRLREDDVSVPMRDGTSLLADVHRPDAPGKFAVLVAASPYPRQIQDLGAPMGFIEAGASDFFVPRGYVHVIANLRGTGGSGGTFGFFDEQERRDMHDLVEWAAQQPWSDGNVGMIGISYFAMTQLEAATQQPPHLKAIFPVAVTPDLYEGASHHGLLNATFVTPFLSMVGMTSGHGDELWRGKVVNAARHILNTPHLHAKFATMNGESSIGAMKAALKLHHDPYPWDDLWRSVAVEHPLRDAWWDQRNVLPLLAEVNVPVYLGCDWENVPLHLPGTFTTWAALRHNPNVRVAMLGDFGLTWPWESLHIEALAWFDHWLKGAATNIMDGPPIRYWLPGAEQWRTTNSWPPPESELQQFALQADGILTATSGQPTADSSASDLRGPAYLTLGAGLNRAQPSPTDPPSYLAWSSEILTEDIDMVGDIELLLDATSTAADTAWIITLQELDRAGGINDITAGYLRASQRHVDENSSRPGAPELPCRTAAAVPVGDEVHYRIPLAPNARRLKAGHRIRLHITSDDQPADTPAIMGFRHATVGTSTLNTIHPTSRLLLPRLNPTPAANTSTEDHG